RKTPVEAEEAVLLDPEEVAGEVSRAVEAVSKSLRATPARLSEHFSEQLGIEVYLKPENFQRTGSFKVRGAIYALSRLNKSQKNWGVVTASAGNHGQGVAFAAKRMGVRALVVMPESTPNTKLDAVRALGVEADLCGANFDEAYAHAKEIEAERGLVMIPPFDHPDVIAGQGTIAHEVLEEIPDVGTVVVPVGGGGLISGVASAVKTRRPDVRIVGVAAEGAPSLSRSVDAGRIVSTDFVQTIADGIAVKRIGAMCFPLIQKLVDQVVTVSDDQMARAILSLLERERMLAEAAGAASLAALLERRARVTGKVVALITGGNLDVNLLSRIIGKGLAIANRYARLQVPLHDAPGSLARLSETIADCRVNIIHIEHDRLSIQVPINHTLSTLHLEVRGREHLEQLVQRLISEGYDVLREEK
ncbi:MAG: threonine ammonia-lyase, partial [Nitrospinota bacterium]|nr:threonine ammonia-lyase [Nitrospinota bacterium]